MYNTQLIIVPRPKAEVSVIDLRQPRAFCMQCGAYKPIIHVCNRGGVDATR